MDLSSYFANLQSCTGLTVIICDRLGVPLEKLDYVSNYEKLLFLEMCQELDEGAFLRRSISLELPIFYYACADAEHCYLIGPVAHNKLSASSLYAFKKLLGTASNRLVYLAQSIVLLAGSILLGLSCHKNYSVAELQEQLKLDESDLRVDIIPARQKIEQIDTFQINHSYMEEQRSLQYVREGDLSALQSHMNQKIIAYPSPVKNSHKNTEYMCVALLSVVSRAAIEGGLPSVDSFLYSDEFLRMISEAKSEEELGQIANRIKATYTKLVYQARLQDTQNMLVVKCKRLIRSQLLSPLSLSSLAQEMNVSSEHLARCFKSETGMTVTQYFLSKRIDLACELLTHTNISIRDIAEHLQFHSTSYFIVTFKKQKGVTPNAYRKRNMMI